MNKIKIWILLFSLLIAGCGISIKNTSHKNLSNTKVRVDVKNKTYEAGATYIFKDACESSLTKKGAHIVEYGEDYFIELVLKEIKITPISFNSADVASNYNLIINGDFKIVKLTEKETKTLLADTFSSTQNFPVTTIEFTETRRQLALMQAAYEITESIKDRLVMLLY